VKNKYSGGKIMNRQIQFLCVGLIAMNIGLYPGSSANAKEPYNFYGTPAQIQTAANLTQLRNQISDRITVALTSGRISQVQADQFRAQIDSNIRQQLMCGQNGISFTDAQNLLSNLNSIDAQLQSCQTPLAPAPLPVLSNPWRRFGAQSNYGAYGKYGNNARYGPGYESIADVSRLESRISDRLERERREGRLSPAWYTAFKRELDASTARRTNLLTSRGYMNYEQKQGVVNTLQSLDHKIDSRLDYRHSASRFNPWF
jgi:hypothetical protein